VLTLTLPKRTSVAAKSIAIQ